MRLGYHTITWGGVVGDATGVTSVKDLYYRANGSMEQAIGDIGSLGYEGVEMFDGNVADYADRPDLLRGLFERAGVQLVSVYTGGNFVYEEILADELSRVTRAAELAATFGAGQLVVGGGARRSGPTPDSDYSRLADALDQITEVARARGVTASYHPHLTTIVESPQELDRLMSKTSIGLCPDTGHLAAGGGSPADVIHRYPDRIKHLHLKDVRLETSQFVPLGQGDLDFPDILQAVQDTGYAGWLLVELDSVEGDPREAAAKSKIYLDSLPRFDGSPTDGERR